MKIGRSVNWTAHEQYGNQQTNLCDYPQSGKRSKQRLQSLILHPYRCRIVPSCGFEKAASANSWVEVPGCASPNLPLSPKSPYQIREVAPRKLITKATKSYMRGPGADIASKLATAKARMSIIFMANPSSAYRADANVTFADARPLQLSCDYYLVYKLGNK